MPSSRANALSRGRALALARLLVDAGNHQGVPCTVGQSEHSYICLQGMVLSAINGVGLALVIPNAQSITADYYDELDRGKAFGALYMTSALGGAFGSLYATNQGGVIPPVHASNKCLTWFNVAACAGCTTTQKSTVTAAYTKCADAFQILC